MQTRSLATLFALLVLSAVHGHAQYNPTVPAFLARFLGGNASRFTLTRSTPAGSVSIEASVTPSGASYSATMTAPSGASMGVSGTATNLSRGGASFSGSITSSQGPSASYSGSMSVEPGSVSISTSVTPAGGDPVNHTATITPTTVVMTPPLTENGETALQKILRRLGVIRTNG